MKICICAGAYSHLRVQGETSGEKQCSDDLSDDIGSEPLLVDTIGRKDNVSHQYTEKSPCGVFGVSLCIEKEKKCAKTGLDLAAV